MDEYGRLLAVWYGYGGFNLSSVTTNNNLVILLRIKHLALYNFPQFSMCKIKGFNYDCLVLDRYNILLYTGKKVPFDKNKKTNDYNDASIHYEVDKFMKGLGIK